MTQSRHIEVRPVHIAILVILAAFYILSLVFYPQMPETMASHWNDAGVADGFTSRFWGLFTMPFIVTGIAPLLWLVPYIDPRKSNIALFRKYYDWFVVLFLLYMLYVHVLTLLWNLDYRFNMSQLLIPASGILFIFVGIMLRNAKRNYMIGIRTPWTLANDEVWERTHLLGGRLFIASGIISMAGIFFPDAAVWIMLAAITIASLVSLVYSWWLYQQLNGSIKPAD